MGDSLIRFCVSWTTINVVKSAIKNFIAAWNEHRLPGRIPNVLARKENQTVRLNPATIPDTSIVIQLHEQNGRQLTRESLFGRDPLAHHPLLWERDYTAKHPNM